jgi:hypothetical protein
MSAWPYPVGKKIRRDGSLLFGERAYWSRESMELAGQWVSLRLPGADDQMVTFWQGDEEKARKYAAHLMTDAGFVSPSIYVSELARQAREVGRARRASIVRLQAELLVELMHDRDDDAPMSIVAAVVRKLRHYAKPLENLLGIVGIKLFEHKAHGDLQRADRFKARLRLAERIFELGQFGFDGHSLSPAADEGEPNLPADPSQRLCRDAKKSQGESGAGGDR